MASFTVATLEFRIKLIIRRRRRLTIHKIRLAYAICRMVFFFVLVFPTICFLHFHPLFIIACIIYIRVKFVFMILYRILG